MVGQEGGAVVADPQVLPVADPAELATVDDQVPSVGGPVTLEAVWNSFMGQEPRAGVTPGLGVGHEGAAAADVIEVAVGVDEVGDRLVAPPP